MGTTCCGVHSIIALGVIGWGTTFRGGTYSLLMSVLGGDNLRGVIFFTARVFLEGTPVMGTYGFHYCPGVLGGDTYDGKVVGYNVVPPPPTGLFAPPTIDLSNSGLKEFQLPEFEGYGVKV
ncbi:hypothetical protein Tco_0912111 [Tanacetum coccineum]